MQPLLLTPGVNHIRLKKKATKVGKFFLGQLALHIGNLHLYSPLLLPRLSVEVKEEGPTLKLYKRAAPLLSGIEQIMNLIVTIGSYSIEPVSNSFMCDFTNVFGCAFVSSLFTGFLIYCGPNKY